MLDLATLVADDSKRRAVEQHDAFLFWQLSFSDLAGNSNWVRATTRSVKTGFVCDAVLRHPVV